MTDWLTRYPADAALVDEAVRLVDEAVTPDTCQDCGGNQCDRCRPNLVDHSKAWLR